MKKKRGEVRGTTEAQSRGNRQDNSAALEQAAEEGVLAVRPGYAFTGGWITNQPAAVAIVDKKKKHVPPKDLLPTRIDDTAVDVQEAGPIERLRHTRPQDYARIAHGRPEYNIPAAPFERTMNKTGAPPAPFRCMRKRQGPARNRRRRRL